MTVVLYFDLTRQIVNFFLPFSFGHFQITIKWFSMMLNSSKPDDHSRPFTLFQGDDGPIVPAVMRMMFIRIQINDLFSILGQPRMIPGIGRPDAQGLEQHAEEPGQQDVTRHQPGQLLAVFFTVTNGHDFFDFGKILTSLADERHW